MNQTKKSTHFKATFQQLANQSAYSNTAVRYIRSIHSMAFFQRSTEQPYLYPPFHRETH